MMMPQQMQMPPMPPGLSIANFVRRMFLKFIHLFEKFFLYSAPMPGMPFMGPPAGFLQMGYNGPRF